MPEKANAKLNFNDRLFIDERLRKSVSVNRIAKKLGVARSTIAREIQRNRVEKSPSFLMDETHNICLRKDVCHVRSACKNGCIMPCKTCKKGLCNRVCPEFLPNLCPKLSKAPFVCNDCGGRYGFGCEFKCLFYDAKLADEMAKERRVESRQGVDCTREELLEMASVAKPLLAQGQSLEHIWATHAGEMKCSVRTFYRYIENGAVDIINLELRKKVSFKPRRSSTPQLPRHDLTGRTYAEFLDLPLEVQMSAVEMDCVEGKRGDSKAILTLLFRRYCFQLMMLLDKKDQIRVGCALDSIQSLCGKRFKEHFGVILTDRGSEFLDPDVIERGRNGEKRCAVYYCDPMKSGQKGRCEKNHVELRKVIPKGTSLMELTERELSVVCSHVNSYRRKTLGGASPFMIASQVLPAEIFEGLGLELIDPDEVVMKPKLLQMIRSKELL